MADDQMFQEAIEAIKNGQRNRARDLLNRLLRVDNNNIDYWLYMSSVVDSPKERNICLENALRIDPNNPTALRGLSLLGHSSPDRSITPVKPIRTRKFSLPEIITKVGESEQTKKLTRMPVRRLVNLGILSLVGFLLIYIGIFGNPFSDGQLRYILPSEKDLQPLPTEVPPTATIFFPDAPATPIFGGATPLAYFLDAPHTATPRVVDTPHPESQEFNLGLAAFDLGDYETAIKNFRAHVNEHPGDADARFYLGLSYYQLGEYQDADEAFIYSSNVNPEFGYAYLWEVFTKMEYLEEPGIGEKLNTTVLKIPDYYLTYLTRGEYFLRNLNMELALGDLETSLELAPDNARVQLFAANYYFANGLYEEALLAAQTSLTLDNTIIDTYIVLGLSYYENDLFEEAISPIQTFLTYETENGEAWYYLGRAHQNIGEHEVALIAFDQVEKLKQGIIEVFLYKGLSLYELDLVDEAILEFNRAFLFFPDQFEAKLYHGVGLMEGGEVGEGYFEINASSSFAKTDQQKAMLYYWRGHSLERLNEPVKARQDWDALLALDSEYVPQDWAEVALRAIQGGYNTPTPISNAPTRVPTSTPRP
ncbi:MAG: tetratricopeptide repeat protein [Chloroflexi bacterium]|jgi:tetratricopeptide (TPR) repeat protein|nr:tetratricopeptide repeat protein [Chloroflexota bacterium]MBT3670538.1 tetratricopeptide repeat protein [Chloroflexota bacterium]MBT4001952.1 tetratricopeptide repeat protein [Chloroflexota bacterium]MBT4304173.1 tetratricopeptide repeat protein [Chloroflexota bacterium]MBT4533468.1 tetratricopeptide repeat protein [Chloroflexota bacterium]